MVERTNLPFSELTAVTPLDGRYRGKIAELAPHVSEFNLIRTRIEVEAKYLVALSDIGVVRDLTEEERKKLNFFGQNVNYEDALKVKQIEDTTRHDVKAMERAFRMMLAGTSLEDLTEMIHFGLTSEDVNNLAYRLMLKRATRQVCIPVLDTLTDELIERANRFKAVPMIGRTHGQAAVPTTIGKEFVVFAVRLNKEVRTLDKAKLTGKLTGAVGNFNALQLAYPKIDWISFSERFMKSLGFEPNLTTTQINPYEDIVSYLQNYERINNIIIDLDQDLWRYISDHWFVQEVKKGEVGSSTMPQKVNPIDFENSEGNLGMANAITEFLSRKLMISRLQRDLSDSTAIRNIGTALGYSLVGYKSVLNGLSRVRPNEEKISEDLDKDWSILTEAAQTILRKNGVKDSYYSILKNTRGRIFKEEDWLSLVNSLPIKRDDKKLLLKLTPGSYLGLSEKLTDIVTIRK